MPRWRCTKPLFSILRSLLLLLARDGCDWGIFLHCSPQDDLTRQKRFTSSRNGKLDNLQNHHETCVVKKGAVTMVFCFFRFKVPQRNHLAYTNRRSAKKKKCIAGNRRNNRQHSETPWNLSWRLPKMTSTIFEGISAHVQHVQEFCWASYGSKACVVSVSLQRCSGWKRWRPQTPAIWWDPTLHVTHVTHLLAGSLPNSLVVWEPNESFHSFHRPAKRVGSEDGQQIAWFWLFLYKKRVPLDFTRWYMFVQC